MVGSSRKITGGFPMRLMAMSRRRRMPPEYVDTLRSAASVSWKRASRSSAIRLAPFRCRSRAIRTRFSRPVRISSTAANCPVRLMDSRTSAGCVATSKPATVTVPASGLSSVDRMFTTVVLPAPLEPSRAKMLPRATSKSTPRSTRRSLYDFSRPCTCSAWTGCVVIGISLGSGVFCGGAFDGAGQPFPLPGDPLTLWVVPEERLGELHGVLPDDLADRGAVRRALLEEIGKVVQHRQPAVCRPTCPK